MPPRRKAAAAAATAAVDPAPAAEANKENVAEGAAVPVSPPVRAAGKGLKGSRKWEEEVDVLTQQLNKMRLEKEAAQRQLEEQEAKIKEQHERISTQIKEQSKLQDKIKKLEKAQTTLSEDSDDPKGKKKKKENQADAKPKKKEKDPEKPKRPATGYLAYSEERRPALMSEKNSVPQIGKILGEEWRNMDEEARAPYEKIAAEAKAAYVTEMEAYNKKKAQEKEAAAEEVPEEKEVKQKGKAAAAAAETKKAASKTDKPEKAPRKTKAKAAEPGKPKRSLSAYNLFGMEYRKKLQAENPAAKFGELNSMIASKWKEMSAEEKQPYVDQAGVEKEKYQEAMEEYKKNDEASAST